MIQRYVHTYKGVKILVRYENLRGRIRKLDGLLKGLPEENRIDSKSEEIAYHSLAIPKMELRVTSADEYLEQNPRQGTSVEMAVPARGDIRAPLFVCTY